MTPDRFAEVTQNFALDMARVTDSVVTGALIVGCTAMAFTVFLCWVDWWSTKATYREMGRLLTHSSAFWARWPNDRIWSAPYGELAAEADRCQSIIGYVSMKKPTSKRAETELVEVIQRVEREEAMYQNMLATVHSAMNYAISQGRGPQQQPYRA